MWHAGFRLVAKSVILNDLGQRSDRRRALSLRELSVLSVMLFLQLFWFQHIACFAFSLSLLHIVPRPFLIMSPADISRSPYQSALHGRQSNAYQRFNLRPNLIFNSHISPSPLLIITEGTKRVIWPLSFRNVSRYLKSKIKQGATTIALCPH